MTILCLLLTFLPSPYLRPICTALQLAGPNESICASKALRLCRELRYAPPLEAAQYLPDHETCYQLECFWDKRVRYIEDQRKLYGFYRWCDCEEALTEAKAAARYWENCRKATSQFENWAERRRALAWLDR